MSNSDRDIIERSWEDGAAFAAIYDRHERTVYRYSARRLGPTVADDITSETFLVAFSRRHDFTGSENARPWLLGIATLLMRRHTRLEARAWKGMLASDLARMDVDELDAVDSRLDAGALTGRVGKALGRLAPGDRDALLLYAFGGLDYEGVAAALKVPVGTVRSRLSRARRKLRSAIDSARLHDQREDHGRDLAPAPSTK